tara:strand:+ start:1861 stop:2949 length:1089 start_codon:yes stop_codon:yes gene_type:complete
MKKSRILILFGGRSAEHEISIISARSLYKALDRNRYIPVLVGISRDGKWAYGGSDDSLLISPIVNHDSRQLVQLGINPGELMDMDGALVPDASFDVIFPLLHGPFGEDGCIQGLFELNKLTYVGAGVAASAVGMDKELSRAIFTAAGLKQTNYLVIRRRDWRNKSQEVIVSIEEKIGYPLFVKPVNLGSSVGVNKVYEQSGLNSAMDAAARYDIKIMIEASIENAREVECALFGNESLSVSGIGEIIPNAEFYSYEAKYVDGNSRLVIPAELSLEVTKRVQDMAIRAFDAIDCAGLARVDFLIDAQGEVFINEVNTMPGFTPISMYPKLWEATGLSYSELIHTLIELAKDRHRDRLDLKNRY